MQEKITACFLCGCNCGLIMTLDENQRIVKIRGDKDNLHSRGHICNKGLNQGGHYDSPHRLTTPLKRKGDRLVEVSWEEAIDGVARELLRVRNRYGPRSIGFAFGGSGHPTVQFMLAFQWARSMGTRNLYSPIGLELSSKYLANQKLFGCSYMDGYPDFGNSTYILLMGTNPVISWPLHRAHLAEAAKDPARTLVVVDPRLTETGRLANKHIPIRPSTDIYFILSLLNVITSESLYGQAIVRRHTRGLDRLKRAVARFTPKAVEKVTGIPKGTLLEVARGLATNKPSILMYDMGLIANRHSTLVSWAVQSIMFILGNSGVKGGTLLNPTLHNFNQSEKRSYGGVPYVSRVRDYPEICGNMPVTVLQDEILTPGPGQIRAMIVTGCNPLRAYTNSNKMERAFRDLEFVVSIDPFLTEVGRMAHYVLPVCSFHEQDNISFGFHGLYAERFVQLTKKIREPVGQSRPEWKIYSDIGKRMGLAFMDAAPIHHGFEIADKIRKFMGKPGVIDRQEAFLRVFARVGRTSYGELEANPHGLILTKGKPVDFVSELRTPDKKVHLDVPEFMAAVDRLSFKSPKKDPQYPLVLSTTARTPANVNALYRNEPWIAKHVPENSLLIHPDDARPLRVKDGERVRMASRTAAAEVPVSFTQDVLRGTVYLSHGWGLSSRDPSDSSGKLRGTAAAQFLPDDEGDEFTGLPYYSGIPCKVEKVKAKATRAKKTSKKKKVAIKKKAAKKPTKKKATDKPKKRAVSKAKTKPVAKAKKKPATAGKKKVVKKALKRKAAAKLKRRPVAKIKRKVG
jgi:anaerobic selenocysteine-containing dehydrogenase